MGDMGLAPVPDWMFPPEGGFEAADLDRLPELPSHTELIDGSLVLRSPQASFHSLVLDVLEVDMRRTLPAHLRVRREMTVTLGLRQRPEPDLIVIKASGETDPGQTTYAPDDVLLAAEVVSPESKVRDRKRKPVLYAEAGIKHFWLVENEQSKPVLHTYLLDPVKGSYDRTGIHQGIVKLNLPYPIEIDFSEIDRL